jgi:hypothetical protein
MSVFIILFFGAVNRLVSSICGVDVVRGDGILGTGMGMAVTVSPDSHGASYHTAWEILQTPDALGFGVGVRLSMLLRREDTVVISWVLMPEPMLFTLSVGNSQASGESGFDMGRREQVSYGSPLLN